jgi:chitinase
VVGQGDGYMDLPVTLSAPGTSTVTVNYAAGPGSGCNYPIAGGIDGTLTFTPGVRTEAVRVPINNCRTTGLSYFTFTLSGAVNGVIIRPSTQVDIVGNGTVSTTPGLYVRDAVVDDSVSTVEVPVLLGGPEGSSSASTVSVKYATTNGSAVAGTDYTAESGTLTFGPGQTVENIAVPITDLSTAALSRSFGVKLSSPTNAVITDGTGVVTIGASGGTPVKSPGISTPPDAVVGQGDGYMDLPVTLSAPGTSTVTVNYAAGPGSGCNYPIPSGIDGTLTFTPGVRTEAVRVPINNCNLTTNNVFTFTLTGAVNSTISRGTTTVTIVPIPKAPGPPKGVKAVAGNGSATVSFNAPASNGGDPINRYTVTASPSGLTASGVSSPITITGLTNGTAYTFTVKATNTIGTGKASAVSAPVTPTS